MTDKKKCTLVMAGPGSGKTYQMVGKVLEELPQLKHNKFMAVITYTNAVAEQITERLSEKIEIPFNVFIGTIHSFLIRFTFKPYGKLFDVIPSDYVIVDRFDMSFLEDKEFDNQLSKIIYTRKIEKNIMSKGVLTHNQVESGTTSLLDDNKKTIRSALGSRLQFLFIDEIQDATVQQYNIVNNLRIEGKTTIYCIGDPEQYIYGFTYKDKHQAVPEFERIPIKMLELNSCVETEYIENEINRRSTPKIVSFLNHFRKPIQKANDFNWDAPDVIFINATNLKEIVSKFNHFVDSELPEQIKKENDFKKFFLSYANYTFEPAYEYCPMRGVSNERRRPRTALQSALDYIAATTGYSKTEILETISSISFRKIGMSILRTIRDNPSIKENELKEIIKREHELNYKDHYQITEHSFRRLVSSFKSIQETTNFSSSIHKAKGLEASAVLALSESCNRLVKWLETDIKKRYKDKNDECRIGFVAFSRAKHLLCIACLENITDAVSKKLESLEVKII